MADYYSAANRRYFIRYLIESSGILILNNNLRQTVIVNDLCPKGAGVYCNRSLDTGQEIEIIISYFFDKLVQKKAKVAWCIKVNENLWRAGLDFGNELLALEWPFYKFGASPG